MGYPEEPTLVVYRTREDTSQDYHIEGLPFGTRGGMLVPHMFPSDGEYTLTVTPIFGDNMSPDRLRLGAVRADRDAARRRAAAADGLAGRRPHARRPTAARAATRPGGPRGGGSPGPEAFFGGRGGTPMRVRFKTTAGTHMVGATFLATNFAPLLDLDQALPALHGADRADARLHVLPARRHDPHRGAVRRHAGHGLAEPPQDLRLHAEDGRRGNARARGASSPTWPPTRSGARPRRPTSTCLMEFYEFGRKEKDFDQGIEMVLARVLASPQFIYRIEEEPATVRAGTGRTASATSTWRRGCRSSSGARRPTPSCCAWPAQGRLRNPGRARAAGAPDAEAPEGRSAGA